MRSKWLCAAILAAALPVAAAAQAYDPGCVASNQQSNAAGTALGAIGGALIGGAIAGPHDRGAGVVAGGVGGAIAGNAIARSGDHPCPPGYYYPAPPPPGPYGAAYGHGVHDRIDFLQDRIDRAVHTGRIGPGEADRANGELNFIRSEDGRLRNQDGGRLRPEDRDYLQQRLDNLGQRLNWFEHNG